ncbi:UDP-3-O-(3-hydroxymyristoyl)glucosamine N-acyltransferase [Prosthecobacter fusiformis]|nr:UDP-3-O-(3-hydroxymyristoyl)glucosamine N-acyltransferase [Prosthecobacter fusiformis]
MNIALSELAELLEGQLLSGSPETRVTGFASLREALAGDLSFYYDARYKDRLMETKATAVLVPEGLEKCPDKVACIAVKNPSHAFEKVVDTYGYQATAFEPVIHPRACIAEDVKADLSKISVAACAVIESGAQIGDGTEIGAGCFVGRNAVIGAGCKLFANVTVYEACELGDRVILHSGTVIGADGFGYEFDKGRHRKVRQAGIVQIDNDVEIGAGTMVDRARFGRTWIGEGTKIDNLVQIGHNVIIGKHCIIVAACAIAGSAVIGDYVVIAAQSGVAGHVNVGSFVTLGARSGVTKDIPTGKATYMGFPAMPVMDERRRWASINRLPHLSARVKALEKGQPAAEDE